VVQTRPPTTNQPNKEQLPNTSSYLLSIIKFRASSCAFIFIKIIAAVPFLFFFSFFQKPEEMLKHFSLELPWWFLMKICLKTQPKSSATKFLFKGNKGGRDFMASKSHLKSPLLSGDQYSKLDVQEEREVQYSKVGTKPYICLLSVDLDVMMMREMWESFLMVIM
jgi:hypothetical protein